MVLSDLVAKSPSSNLAQPIAHQAASVVNGKNALIGPAMLGVIRHRCPVTCSNDIPMGKP